MFKPGESVTVINEAWKNKEKRTGYIHSLYNKFICIKIFPKHTNSISWQECFLYSDITSGTVHITSDNKNKKPQQNVKPGTDLAAAAEKVGG